MKEQIILGQWTEEKLDCLLGESSKIHDPGKRIDFLSTRFLNTKYRESTLMGDITTPEVFVINLKEIDCFTFLDYIEAMTISTSFAGFKKNLKKVRYRRGEIAFENRNHFFTDWREFNSDLVDDVTELAGSGISRHIKKNLNEKDDGTYFIPGVPCREREIVFIPSEAIDENVIGKLISGDYIGIYSEKPGLDVSHTGIVIRDGENIKLRHASSLKRHGKVIDEDLIDYLEVKSGIIVLRPKVNFNSQKTDG